MSYERRDLLEKITLHKDAAVERALEVCADARFDELSAQIDMLQKQVAAIARIRDEHTKRAEFKASLANLKLLEALCILKEYGAVVVDDEMFGVLLKHYTREQPPPPLPPAVAEALDTVDSLYWASVTLQVHEVAPHTSYGRDNDVEWDDAEQTWSIAGVPEPLFNTPVQSLVAYDLLDLSACSVIDEGENDSYSAYRLTEVCDVVLLSKRPIAHKQLDWEDIRKTDDDDDDDDALPADGVEPGEQPSDKKQKTN